MIARPSSPQYTVPIAMIDALQVTILLLVAAGATAVSVDQGTGPSGTRAERLRWLTPSASVQSCKACDGQSEYWVLGRMVVGHRRGGDASPLCWYPVAELSIPGRGAEIPHRPAQQPGQAQPSSVDETNRRRAQSALDGQPSPAQASSPTPQPRAAVGVRSRSGRSAYMGKLVQCFERRRARWGFVLGSRARRTYPRSSHRRSGPNRWRFTGKGAFTPNSFSPRSTCGAKRGTRIQARLEQLLTRGRRFRIVYRSRPSCSSSWTCSNSCALRPPHAHAPPQGQLLRFLQGCLILFGPTAEPRRLRPPVSPPRRVRWRSRRRLLGLFDNIEAGRDDAVILCRLQRHAYLSGPSRSPS